MRLLNYNKKMIEILLKKKHLTYKLTLVRTLIISVYKVEILTDLL